MALDNFRKVNITLNKANQRVLETQIAKAGDANGRELVVQITNNGVIEDQTGTTLKLNWQHENGKQGSTAFSVVDIKTGIFSVYYPTEMLYKGKVNASIEITSNGQITNSMNFKIIVQADVFDGEAGNVDGVFISLAEVNKKLDDREAEYEELKSRQSKVETQFDVVQQELTDKDVISAPEIIAARNSKDTLSDRLDHTDNDLHSRMINVLYPPIPMLGAKGDGLTDDTLAIRNIISSAPTGSTIEFPQVNDGYLLKSDIEKYLFLIDKPLNIRGGGIKSMLLIDSTVPDDTDVFLVKPRGSSDTLKRGYTIRGISAMGTGGTKAGRHVIHFDVTDTTYSVSNSEFSHNIFYQTNGYSIYLTNPSGTTSFFGNQIEKNTLFGGMYLQRCGDSVSVLENVFAGDNDINISLIYGSNTFVFSKNNVTLRKGMVVKSGHNIKIRDNNFEVAYSDSSYVSGALLDIDGSEVQGAWGLLTVEVTGNNFTFRPNTPNVSSIRINKARGTLIEGNHIARSGTTDQIVITSLASDTIVGYNLYSSDKADGYIKDDGVNTVYKDRISINNANGRREFTTYEMAYANEKIANKNMLLSKFEYESVIPNDAPSHTYVWNEANNFGTKHTIYSQKRLSSGILDSQKQIYSIGDGYLQFRPESLMLTDESGFRWKLTIGTDGVLKTTRIG